MIPPDLVSRLRMLTEASFFRKEPPDVQEVARIREIQPEQPELHPGQRITATIERALGDGNYRANVEGRKLNLALPVAAKDGETLELVVTEANPRLVHAQLAQSNAPSMQAALSQTGRLISFLLTGQSAARAADTSGAKPLLQAPPTNAAELAPALRQALAQSGLFYESHQAQWIAGKVSTAALMQEPQGQLGRNPLSTAPSLATPPVMHTSTEDPSATDRLAGVAPGTSSELPSGRAATLERGGMEALGTGNASPIPERLLPIVHQQLDTLATQQFVWNGQVWPGLQMEWTIEDAVEREGRGQAGEENSREWNTTLRLTLPRLGGLEADLHLTPAGVALRLKTRDASSGEALEAGREALAAALSAANVPLTGMVVEQANGR